MRTLPACLAALLLSGFLAAPSSMAEGPVDDLPPAVRGALNGITDICVQPLDGAAPADPLQWWGTWNAPGYNGWRVWLTTPPSGGQWWFVGLCDADDGRLRLGTLCVIPDFHSGSPDPAFDPPENDSDRIRVYKEAPTYDGHLVWFGLGGPTGTGSWWYFGICNVVNTT